MSNEKTTSDKHKLFLSLGHNVHGNKADGQPEYDFDDVPAFGNAKSSAGFLGDCWREDLYEKYGIEDAN